MSPKSSVPYSAILTPDKFSHEWRQALGLTLTCLASLPVLLQPEPAVRHALCCALILLAGLECLLIGSAPRFRVSRLQLSADGSCEVSINDRCEAVELSAGSWLGTRIGWLHGRSAGGRRFSVLVRAGANPSGWRRARVIWRHAGAAIPDTQRTHTLV